MVESCLRHSICSKKDQSRVRLEEAQIGDEGPLSEQGKIVWSNISPYNINPFTVPLDVLQ